MAACCTAYSDCSVRPCFHFIQFLFASCFCCCWVDWRVCDSKLEFNSIAYTYLASCGKVTCQVIIWIGVVNGLSLDPTLFCPGQLFVVFFFFLKKTPARNCVQLSVHCILVRIFNSWLDQASGGKRGKRGGGAGKLKGGIRKREGDWRGDGSVSQKNEIARMNSAK